MTEMEMYENKVRLIRQLLKTDFGLLKSGLVFFAAGVLIAILGAATESLLWLLSLIFFAVFVWCMAFFIAYIIRDRNLLKTMNSLASFETETKELHCYKYTCFLHSNSATDNRTSVLYGICVHTVLGKYYYLLNEGFSFEPGTLLPGAEIGLHEIEVYKGTNIITAFNSLDQEIDKIQ